jgi:hypothetical protein
VYDVDGPRVRLGMAWFVLAVAALVGGPLLTAVLYGTTAAVAAAQTARAWRRRRARPSEPVAAAGAGAVALGAVFGPGGVGVALLGLAGAAVWWAYGDARSRRPLLVDAGLTVQCGMFAGLAAASMVLALRLDIGAAIALLLLASAYEVGDFLIGSGARSTLEGPVAGIAAMLVVIFVVGWFGLAELDFTSATSFGLLAVPLCPAGQLLASAVLPDAASPASALRRLDSLLLLAPLWAWAIGVHLEATA